MIQNSRKFYLIVIPIIVAFGIFLFMCFFVPTIPKYKGTYRIEDYPYYSEDTRGLETLKYGEIKNKWDACRIAEKVIQNKFPNSGVNRFSAYYERWCFFDEASNTWFVYIGPRSTDILDGSYGCIISSQGIPLACWSPA